MAMLEISLQQIFALTPSTISQYLSFARKILLETVRDGGGCDQIAPDPRRVCGGVEVDLREAPVAGGGVWRDRQFGIGGTGGR